MAAKAEKPLEVSSTSHLRDLAASAARIFGWDNERQGNTYNALVISREDLAKIRSMREAMTGDVTEPRPSQQQAVVWPSATNLNKDEENLEH